jgi:hypothetical protein
MSTTRTILAGALLTCLSVFAGPSDVRAADRIDVPIKQTTLSNGLVRYSIPVVFGGKSVDAMLDTGSTGLSVLTSAIPASSYAPSKFSFSIGFVSGQKFIGHVDRAVIGLGNAPKTATVEINAIDSLGCSESTPHCARQRYDNGLVGGNIFNALVGVSLPSPALVYPLTNPLLRFGDSWIIVLPRPGERAPGHLIINPTADERNGFDLFPAGQGFNVGGDQDNPLPGCLIHEADGRKLCGPIDFDSGKSDITEISHDLSLTHWPVGTSGAFSFDVPGGKTILAKFKVAQAPTITHVFVGPSPSFHQPAPRVKAGVEPFMLFSVLYDFRRGQIGLKAR